MPKTVNGKKCTVCCGTGYYVNARGVKSDVPCNQVHDDD